MGLFNDEIKLREKVIADSSGVESKTVSIPRWVGFDRIKVSPIVKAVDWNVFEAAYEKDKNEINHLMIVHPCRSKDLSLELSRTEKKEHWYSYIHIIIGTNNFIMKHPSLPNRRGDDITFDVCVPSIEGHECLGNVKNQTVDEKKNHVLQLFDVLQSRYGIVCDRRIAIMRDVELNVNFVLSGEYGDFRDVVRRLSMYQTSLKNFKNVTYTKSGKDKIYKSADTFESIVPTNKTNTLESVSKTRVLKIYDKSEEIIDNYKKKNSGFSLMVDHISRIEIELKKKEEIKCYFEKKDNLFDLDQLGIEMAFTRFVEKFLTLPIKQYYKEMDESIEKLFKAIKINEYAWKQGLINDIISTLGGIFYEFLEEDLKSFVSLIPAPSVISNRARIIKQLTNEIRKNEGRAISIVSKRSHEELMDWLTDIKKEGEEQIVAYKIV